METQQSNGRTYKVLNWIRQAGQIAMSYFNNHTLAQPMVEFFKMTEVSAEIADFLITKLAVAFPNDTIVGTFNTKVALTDRIWAIDPLDGITAFRKGLPGWGISVGLLEYGIPVFGLFYMPLLNDMTYTSGNRGVWFKDTDIRGMAQKSWLDGGFLATSDSAHDEFNINIRRTWTVGGIGSSLIYTARGSAIAAFIPKAYVWDLVAGAVILERTGGELRYLSGKAINYSELLDGRLIPEPVIAGHLNVLAELQLQIEERDQALSLLTEGEEDEY